MTMRSGAVPGIRMVKHNLVGSPAELATSSSEAESAVTDDSSSILLYRQAGAILPA